MIYHRCLKFLIGGGFLFFFALSSYPQKIILNREEIIRRALRENVDLIVEKNILKIRRNDYIQALMNTFVPDIEVGVNTPYRYTKRGRNDPPFRDGRSERNEFDIQGSFEFRQNTPLDTALGIRLLDTYNAVPEGENRLLLGFTLSQPLFQRNDLRYNQSLTKKTYDLAVRQLAQGERNIIEEAESRYYDLILANKNIELTERRIAISISNLTLAENKYRSGLITEIAVLRISLEHKRNQERFNEFTIRKTEQLDNLAEFLNLPPGEQVDVAATFEYFSTSYDLEGSIRRTLSNDVTLHRIALDQWREKLDYRGQADNYRFIGDLNFSVDKDLDPDGELQVELGLDLKSPLYKRGEFKRLKKNHALRMENLERRKKGRIYRISNAIETEIANLKSHLRNVDVSITRLEIASKAYNIDTERFAAGLIKAETLIDTEDDYFNAELQIIREKINYLRARSTLENRFWMEK